MSVNGFIVDNAVQKYNYESLENYNTPDFNTSSTYQVGDYVMYQGKLYKCKTAITTGEAWDSTKWSLAILSDDFTAITEYVLDSFVTPGIDNTANGVTRKTSSDGEKLILYGESIASRRICFLNGQNSVKITSSEFSKTLDAGTYLIETDMTGYESAYSFEATYTTYTNSFRIVDSTNKSTVITFTAPVMVGIVAATGRNYGTEENPTYVTFTAKKLTAIDTVARGKNAVLFDPQTLDSVQQEQARKNIDGVGNETLFLYNAYNALDYDLHDSGTNNGIAYTNNGDGSWTINGTATDDSFYNIIGALGSVIRCIIPGRKYRFNFNGGTIPVRVYVYRNGTLETRVTYSNDFEITLPEDLTGFLIRFQIASGVTVSNATVKYSFVPVTNTSINNNYTYNTTVDKTVQQYDNTFNMSVSPTITTDTNGWLQSVDSRTSNENGKTDMTPAIMAMLTQTGYCHLGEGVFYVSGNIDMPEGSTIEGCGYNTIIQLLSSVESGYCVRMQKRNTISNLRINGAFSSITVDGTQGTRTGILFVANEDGQEGTTAFDSECCMVNNVWVDNFSDSGIKCHNTSISTYRGMYVTNVYIARCWAAINIDYYSEFHKFTNVCTYSSWYGCINNGGNNVFTACTFYAYYVGFYIDGTQPNAAHGTINGCTFCHIGNNDGTALKLENILAGYIVANCQIWYCGIEVVNCRGVLFDGCEFGRGKESDGSVCASISVTGGQLTMFSGCMFHLDATRPPKITITNNTMTVFNGCYGTESGLPITAP